jgi:hypothetical protein
MITDSTFDNQYLKRIGVCAWINTRDEADNIKHKAAIAFIGIHRGSMLLNSVILNIQPVRSRMLRINTIIIDIQTHVCTGRGKPNEYQCGLGI